MGSPGARTGTLPEGQVRAMFDRIAGFYDAMNAVMTAGLDQRWRERAADLAALARSGRLGLLRGDAGPRAREGARPALGVGQCARAAVCRRRVRGCHGGLRRAQLLGPGAWAGRDGAG